jgi:hypothetical protein
MAAHILAGDSPDAMEGTRGLRERYQPVDGSVPVHITHPKPGEVDAVVAQIRAIDTAHRIEPLVKGLVFEL